MTKRQEQENMLTLHENQLDFQFPGVHERARLSVTFQRTLRVPDDNREYPLPAGLGRFPVRHVDDYASRLPGHWRQHGGVLIPMYQSEALWINFRSSYPMAVKIAAGKINAITGGAHQDDLGFDPQDYLVTPEQPWLDGFCISKGNVRQFVAMPLGEGFSAEEQITQHAQHGGLQIVCSPMKVDVYERLHSKPAPVFELLAMCDKRDHSEMGLAPGGLIRQQIHKDPHEPDAWDQSVRQRCFVHLANSLLWEEITGEPVPPTPITPGAYERAGIPWFDFYFDEAEAIEGGRLLAGLDGVAAKTIKQGGSADKLAAPVAVSTPVDLSPNRNVRQGKF